MLVPISLSGKTAQHRSPALANERTVGFYPETAGGVTTLQPFPGLKLFGSVNRGVDRGMFEFQGNVYKVTGGTLYSVDSNGNHSIIGDISGEERCVFAGINNDLVIVSNGAVYFYDVDSPEDTGSFTPGWTYTGKSFDVSSQVSSAGGGVFGDSGSKFYIVDRSTSIIYQYALGVPYDLTTAGYSGKSKDVSGTDSAVYDIAFDYSGYYLTFYGSTTTSAYLYFLSTAWDISTATSQDTLVDFSSQDSAPLGISDYSDFNAPKLLMCGDTNDSLYAYEPGYIKTGGTPSFTLTYLTESLDVSSQDTNPRDATFSSDGLSLFVLGGANDTIYQYNLTTAFDISTGTYSSNSLDVSSQGTNPVSIIGPYENTNNIYMIDGTNNKIYQYGVTTTVTDGDLESPNAVAHINTQAIYDGLGGRWCSSDVGDATSINGLNYATAESSPDSLIRPYVFQQTLFLFGEKTTETWWNSGVGNPPFDRIEGGIFPIGLAALHSTASNDNYLYFLGDDRKVYRITSSSRELVSTISLTHAIESYSDISDAIGSTYSFEGQNFYQLTFPSQNKTWAYAEGSNEWFEPSKNRYVGDSFVYAFNKNLVADYRNGNIYEMDINTYDENGDQVTRIRQTGAIHGGLFGKPGKRIEMNRLELIMEVGVGRTPAYPDIDINTLTYQSAMTYNFSSQESAGKQVVFKPDGLKMYVVGTTNDSVFQYTLSTAWDVTTATYASKTYDFSSQSTNPSSMAFKPDGRIMYISDDTGATVYQYTLSTAWDVSTASYASKSVSVSSQETAPRGFTFKIDGTKMYVVGTAADTVFQYSLSTAWDVSTATYDSVSFSVSSEDGFPGEVQFNESGDVMIIIGNTNDKAYQYTLSTAWDISTATYTGKDVDVSGLTTSPTGLYITKEYVFLNTSNKVWRLTPPPTDNRHDPEIMMSFSDDGGDTFSTEMRGKIGQMGKFVKVEWHSLGSFYNRILKFSISDPVFCSIHAIAAEVDIGI